MEDYLDEPICDAISCPTTKAMATKTRELKNRGLRHTVNRLMREALQDILDRAERGEFDRKKN